MHSQGMYQRSYPVSEGLRPNLQIELTLRCQFFRLRTRHSPPCPNPFSRRPFAKS